MGCYSRLMVRHPFVLIVVDVVLAFVLGPLTVWIFGLPDFSDPTKGFEARGSKITTWEMAAKNIYQETTLKPPELLRFPTNYTITEIPTATEVTATRKRKRRYITSTLTTLEKCVLKESEKLDIADSAIVVTSKTGANLFTTSHLLSICRLQDAVSSYPWRAKSCYPLSLPLYVAALAKKDSCNDINDEDVRKAIEHLQYCSQYYFNGMMKSNCLDPNDCAGLPIKCRQLNAAYAIMHLLTNTEFLADGNQTLTKLDFSLIILSRYWYEHKTNALMEYFTKTFDEKVVEDDDVIVSGLHMNIEQQVFGVYVKRDISLYALAMVMVVVVLLLYLQSIVLMIAVVANVVITLCLSFFIYYYVIQLHFFPFINLIAALLLIAISADDVFIIYDLWRKELRVNPDSSYETIMSETLRKGGLSIFVTSLTTAASLLANAASPITTIRCFGVFAGICILTNFILMITWIPALIILIEKAFTYCIPEDSYGGIRRCSERLAKASDHFWGVIMTKIITVGSPIWVIVLIVVGGLGLIAVFVKPGLKLPEDNYVKVFNSKNPFEVYRREYKNRIRFEHQLWSSQTIRMQFLWGVKGVDNGDKFDPDKKGSLVFVPFDVYTPEGRIWQNQFCRRLQAQSFVRDEQRSYECYFEALERIITGSCNKTIEIPFCCDQKTMPNRTMTELCMKHFAEVTQGRLEKLAGGNIFGELVFNQDNDIKIFRYIFYTNTLWTPNHGEIGTFVDEVERFAKEQLVDAPGNLKDGWFASYAGFQLVFFDLQNAISYGTMMGIGLSLACSLVVLLATSLNVIITVYAIFTISLIIGSTVGTLLFLGWELNVTESLTITMSLGLAVDFTIHYGVSYMLIKSDSRAVRIKETVSTVSSAISMAALTTFVSGACVLGSQVLAYRQFGLFLVFVMFYSWTFSTFFFLPLCYGIGPLNDTGSLTCLFACCFRGKRTKRPDRVVPADEGNKPSESNGRVASLMGHEPSTAGRVPNDVFLKRPDFRKLTPLSALGSLESKFRSSSESIVRSSSPGRSRSNASQLTASDRGSQLTNTTRYRRGSGEYHNSPRSSPANSMVSSRFGYNHNASNGSAPNSYPPGGSADVYDVHVYRMHRKMPKGDHRANRKETRPIEGDDASMPSRRSYYIYR
ncbi:hypothetical protein LSH36_47g00000 [Paralvinella palmiformis]|uniref:SSD domain-containing protein n=1 Tax=Paralvinella palmiformis TaxID=53620 RepID=A0AAD9K658_9ANNE|nr:hypothetical protein LSH36_47g00000 [Paralvinella palmiformis]